jgi:hypothetical protein
MSLFSRLRKRTIDREAAFEQSLSEGVPKHDPAERHRAQRRIRPMRRTEPTRGLRRARLGSMAKRG